MVIIVKMLNKNFKEMRSKYFGRMGGGEEGMDEKLV